MIRRNAGFDVSLWVRDSHFQVQLRCGVQFFNYVVCPVVSVRVGHKAIASATTARVHLVDSCRDDYGNVCDDDHLFIVISSDYGGNHRVFEQRSRLVRGAGDRRDPALNIISTIRRVTCVIRRANSADRFRLVHVVSWLLRWVPYCFHGLHTVNGTVLHMTSYFRQLIHLFSVDPSLFKFTSVFVYCVRVFVFAVCIGWARGCSVLFYQEAEEA